MNFPAIFVGGSVREVRESETPVLNMFFEGSSDIPVTIFISTANTSSGNIGNQSVGRRCHE